jgi:hypothetical protein
MADAVKPNPLRFGFVGTDQPDDVKQQRTIAGEAWRIELTAPRTIMESYKVLRVGPAEIEQHRDGLYILDPMVVLPIASACSIAARHRRPMTTPPPASLMISTRSSNPRPASFGW